VQSNVLEPGDTGIGAAPQESAWTQRVGAFALLPAIIRQLGGDAEAVLLRAGLPPGALDWPESRISYVALARLFDEAVRETGCAHFGLLAGRAWHLPDLGLLGEIVRNTPLVGSALETLAVHQHINSGGGMAFVREQGGLVDYGYAVYHPEVIDPVQLYAAFMAGGYNFMRELAGPDWRPTEVLLPHARPADVTHYRNVFKVLPRFDCEIGALRFPAHWLKRAVDGADAAARRDAEERIRSLAHPELIQQVYRAVRRLLLDDRHSGDAVARNLAMHRRTLNRRLHAHGTTFQEVLDHVRYDLARQLLATSDVALDDIAATLGYAGVSPFMRTFRRWSGETPAQWRRAAKSMLALHIAPHARQSAWPAPARPRDERRVSEPPKGRGAPGRHENAGDGGGGGVAKDRETSA
jgi:AraC-like DNA-binding protein